MVTMPPSPPVAVAEPPSPPSPPVTVPPTTLKALPVVPEVATAPELAPELARLLADAEVTVAEPVKPELPATTKEPVPPKTVLPEKAAMALVVPPMIAWPRSSELVAVAFTVAAPVGPMSPELPDVATGLAVAVELAGPVLPLLLADDWAVTSPERPLVAVGLRSRLPPPPLPPLASALVVLLPPVASPMTTMFPVPPIRLGWTGARVSVSVMVGLMVTRPPLPPVASAEPPSPPSPPPMPPLPPLARAVVVLLPPVAAPTTTALSSPLRIEGSAGAVDTGAPDPPVSVMVGLMVTSPPLPPVADAEPPEPPSPPVIVPPTALWATPLSPDVP